LSSFAGGGEAATNGVKGEIGLSSLWRDAERWTGSQDGYLRSSTLHDGSKTEHMQRNCLEECEDAGVMLSIWSFLSGVWSYDKRVAAQTQRAWEAWE